MRRILWSNKISDVNWPILSNTALKARLKAFSAFIKNHVENKNVNNCIELIDKFSRPLSLTTMITSQHSKHCEILPFTILFKFNRTHIFAFYFYLHRPVLGDFIWIVNFDGLCSATWTKYANFANNQPQNYQLLKVRCRKSRNSAYNSHPQWLPVTRLDAGAGDDVICMSFVGHDGLSNVYSLTWNKVQNFAKFCWNREMAEKLFCDWDRHAPHESDGDWYYFKRTRIILHGSQWKWVL